ncbi:MAG: rhodanese-like domain-containing protein [Gammaproteobacteria bacterium]|nr:rhodanese-like domain-containing protein [Gammaproteobacteria bacterium]
MQDLITFITHHALLSLITGIIFILLIFIELIRAKRKVFDITPTAATQLINHDNAVVIDLRPNDLYRQSHIINAVSLRSEDIHASPKKLEKYRTRTIILVCNSGTESLKIAATLLKQGYNAYSIAGGIRAWHSAQMPLVKE